MSNPFGNDSDTGWGTRVDKDGFPIVRSRSAASRTANKAKPRRRTRVDKDGFPIVDFRSSNPFDDDDRDDSPGNPFARPPSVDRTRKPSLTKRGPAAATSRRGNFAVGDTIELHNLKTVAFNGRRGVLEKWLPPRQRWLVSLFADEKSGKPAQTGLAIMPRKMRRLATGRAPAAHDTAQSVSDLNEAGQNRGPQIAQLRMEMREAAANEQFDRAAELKKQINDILHRNTKRSNRDQHSKQARQPTSTKAEGADGGMEVFEPARPEYVVTVECPSGCREGMIIAVAGLFGESMRVEIPAGVREGDMFEVEFPAAPAQRRSPDAASIDAALLAAAKWKAAAGAGRKDDRQSPEPPPRSDSNGGGAASNVPRQRRGSRPQPPLPQSGKPRTSGTPPPIPSRRDARLSTRGSRESDSDDDDAPQDDTLHHPQLLCCPATRLLFTNPVIAPDGVTYEESYASTRHTAAGALVANKFVQQVATQYKAFCRAQRPPGASEEDILKQDHVNTMQDFFAYLVSADDFEGHPEVLEDPVTFELLEDPCTTIYGNTFSRVVIENYLDTQQAQDPSNRQPLDKSQLLANSLASKIVAAWSGWIG